MKGASTESRKNNSDAETSSDLMIEKVLFERYTMMLILGELSTGCYESSEILPFRPAPLHLEGAGLKSLCSLPPCG